MFIAFLGMGTRELRVVWPVARPPLFSESGLRVTVIVESSPMRESSPSWSNLFSFVFTVRSPLALLRKEPSFSPNLALSWGWGTKPLDSAIESSALRTLFPPF